MSATHVALISPYDAGNLGDAAILESVAAALRRIEPGCRLTAVTLAPQAMPAYHGLPGWPITGASIEFYAINPSGSVTSPLAVSAVPESDAQTTPRRSGIGIGRIPLLGPVLRRLRSIARFAIADLAHWRASHAWLSDVSLVLVAGGGQFDDEWGGAWGHPYALFKWSVLARLRRIPFVIASVGVCRTEDRTARFFFSRAMRNARWLSFRDAQSIEIATTIDAAHRGRHVPDLAFALRATAPAPAGSRQPLRIGVSPIAYRMPGAWPIPDAVSFQKYQTTLIDLIAGLRASGHEVVLFTSERTDRDVVALVQQHFAALGAPPFETALPDQISELLQTLGSLDVVVTSRLHGVIVSHVLGLPVAAISYDRKVRAHMSDVRQELFCIDIDGPDLARASSMVQSLIEARSAAVSAVRAAIAPRRAAVDEQFAQIMALAAQAGPGDKSP